MLVSFKIQLQYYINCLHIGHTILESGMHSEGGAMSPGIGEWIKLLIQF